MMVTFFHTVAFICHDSSFFFFYRYIDFFFFLYRIIILNNNKSIWRCQYGGAKRRTWNKNIHSYVKTQCNAGSMFFSSNPETPIFAKISNAKARFAELIFFLSFSLSTLSFWKVIRNKTILFRYAGFYF